MNPFYITGARVAKTSGKGARTRVSVEPGGIQIEGGRITAIGSAIPKKGTAVSAKGGLVTAPLFDVHVHLREPGREDKETILTASRAAVAGGIGGVLAMPNTQPVIDAQSTVQFVRQRAKEVPICIEQAGSMTQKGEGQRMAEIWEMKNEGVKVVSDDALHRADDHLHRELKRYCCAHGMRMMSHIACDEASSTSCMHEGVVSAQLGLPGTPPAFEDAKVAATIELIKETPVPFHFTQVTTSGAVRAIAAAKKEGLPITADTAIHYLCLTDSAVQGFNTHAKVWPPIRDDTHQKALKEAVKEGVIDAIVSDHAPHIPAEKDVSFEEAAFGIVGMESLFPMALTLVKEKLITLEELIGLLTFRPARIAGRGDLGLLEKGAPASFTLWDTTTPYTIDSSTWQSKARHCPYNGRRVVGKATHMWLTGTQVLSNGTLTW